MILLVASKMDKGDGQEKPEEYTLVNRVGNPLLRFLTSGSSRNQDSK